MPHVELDALHHGPGWQEASAEELRARVEAALAGLDGWVADGNYMGKLGTWLIDQTDAIVWLDLPLRVSLRRMWRRTRTRIRDRTELWGVGNYESWRSFLLSPSGLLWYTLRTHHHRRRHWPPRFEGRNLVRLKTPAEVAAWLERLGV